jgi:PIN domain nuclease of toxin-antitoxin system
VIVLDTHVWLWWVAAPERLSRTAQAEIDEADEIGISAISAWEIAMLANRGRIALDRPTERWVRAALDVDPRTTELALTARTAARAAALAGDGLPGDPADRFIYATARALDARLVTRDARMRAFDAKRTVW